MSEIFDIKENDHAARVARQIAARGYLSGFHETVVAEVIRTTFETVDDYLAGRLEAETTFDL